MAKLRKMMGSIEDPSIIELMALIETQSKQTLAAWTAAYVKEHFLSIYEAAYPEDKRLQDALAAVEEHLQGKLTLKELTPILKEATRAAKDAEANPTAQAAARAVSTACGTIKTPTNALGFAFYGAAAAAYSRADSPKQQRFMTVWQSQNWQLYWTA